MVLVEFLKTLCQMCLTILLPLFELLLLHLSFFLALLLENFAPSHVLLPAFDGHLVPPEEFSQSNIVGIHILDI